MCERIYRDSVHNIIRVNTGTDEGRLVVALIDTTEFQRLRRIRQLGLAYFAYQAAEHSRFTHSLGVVHLAGSLICRVVAEFMEQVEYSFTILMVSIKIRSMIYPCNPRL